MNRNHDCRAVNGSVFRSRYTQSPWREAEVTGRYEW